MVNATLNNTQYDWGKKLVQVILPATGSAYFALGNIWGFPAIENVVGTLAITATFLGTVLGISTRNYRNQPDGTMNVVTDGGGVRTFMLEVDGDPDNLANKEEIRFKVNKDHIPDDEPPAA